MSIIFFNEFAVTIVINLIHFDNCDTMLNKDVDAIFICRFASFLLGIAVFTIKDDLCIIAGGFVDLLCQIGL